MSILPSLPSPTVASLLVTGALLFFFNVPWNPLQRKRRRHLPPGPPRLPIIGNAHQMPTRDMWAVFAEWGTKYGGIIHVDVIGKPLIILNSRKAAVDLLDMRSAIYSNRPHFVMAGDLVRYDESFTLLPYNARWRAQRRIVAQEFAAGGPVARYHAVQEREARLLVRRLLDAQDSNSNSGTRRRQMRAEELFAEMKLRIGTIIVRIAYGYNVQSPTDPFLTAPLAAIANFAVASAPGNFMVDFIPALKYMPRWMPGAGFLETADKWREILWDATWNVYWWSKSNLDTGKAHTPNLCAHNLRAKAADGATMSKDEEDTLVWAATTVMGAGLDTNTSSALSFLMAMVMYPDVQKKAQAEIDAVLGRERLPCIADMRDMPYVRCVMTEVLRWSPGLPFAIPHSSREDDVYEGYDIPKNAIIMPNVWGMLHNPTDYPDPSQFNPDRYNLSDASMQTVHDLVFGFGRRVCPGKHLAEGTLFAIVSTVLATCDILPALDEDGREVLPQYAYTPGTIMMPEPFSVRLRPRSEHARKLLFETPITVE
ncbi:Cytochrome P450 monooxygenase 105 [Psilocybe cubensis]|uniref:Cytochrome P450 n=2 Tax=Psilocybe cubensis TaxID=181762 RepID=A0A8H8CIU7_PSICU|nr:Cytochrome P450 monooxygenase 105 [Psilocybe cubensis]KAH9475817.1 Cytochrome P450 monooxygenase 105 [Psilocybe cubensis]